MSTTTQAWLVIIVSLVALAALCSGATGLIVYRITKKNLESSIGGVPEIKLKMSLVSRLFVALLLTLGLSFLADVLNASGLFINQMNSSYITQAFTFLLGTFTGLIAPDDFKDRFRSSIDKTGKEL